MLHRTSLVALTLSLTIPVTHADEPTAVRGLRLRADARARIQLQAAHDLLRDRAWDRATEVLQNFLDQPEDMLVEIETLGPDGKTPVRVHAGLRGEAQRLLGTMPAEGLQAYEVRFGPRAKEMLDAARRDANPSGYAEIAGRYFHTQAGLEASVLLATHNLGRGQASAAAAGFDLLLAREDFKPTPIFLLKAALAHRACGDTAAMERAFEHLARLSPTGVRVGERSLTLPDLKTELARVAPFAGTARLDHPMFRGGASRSGATGAVVPTLDDDAGSHVVPLTCHPGTIDWIDRALRAEENAGTPSLSAFTPIATGGKVIFRSYRGIHAVDVRTRTVLWEQDCDLSFDNLMSPERWEGKRPTQSWETQYEAHNLPLVYENGTLGTLSTDGNLAFFIDDVALPRHPAGMRFAGAAPAAAAGVLLPHNKLLAASLASGKRIWQAGGQGVLANAYFLGVPLPLQGRLYAVVEINGDMKLVCLNAADGGVCWMQPLGTTAEPLTRDIARRFQSVNLTFADGVLVCPTNAGVVFGIDPAARRIRWAHAYETREPELAPRQQAMRRGQPLVYRLTASLKHSAALVQDGRVVVTAPDSQALFCLNVRDGSRLWKVDATRDDVYLAGVQRGKVLIVGKSACRAVSLATGEPAWNTDTGVPSGMGIAQGQTYYLPLRSSVREPNGPPEICTLDIDTGRIVEHIRTRKGEALGNLVFHDGKVLSQTVRNLAIYP